jgi:hypothetical protein
MDLSHFLKAHNVCVQLLNRQAQIVNFQAPRRTQTLHTFVDVVGGDFQESGDVSFH